MRKVRPDSKLDRLPDDQQAVLIDWLLTLPYHTVRELCAKLPPDGFGLSTSLSALQRYYQRYCPQHLLRRRAQAVSTAEAVAEEASQTPGRFDSATIDQLKQKAFELAISPHVQPKDIKSIFTLVLKARDQELEEQSLQLDREKFELMKRKAEQAERAEQITRSELSPQEKEAKLKAIFGMS